VQSSDHPVIKDVSTHNGNLDDVTPQAMRFKWQSRAMTSDLSTIALEPLRHSVGRSLHQLTDSYRDGRCLDIACWYPAHDASEPLAQYELLAGVTFTASALDQPTPLPGAHPLILFSHGSTGTNLNYSQLIEALASRGFVIIAVNHPGDTTMDWLTGTAVDDATNQRQRVEDLDLVLSALSSGSLEVPPQLDFSKLAIVGHSYGGYSAVAYTAAHGAKFDVKGVVGLQPLITPISEEALRSISAPVLLIGGVNDTTTPIDVNVQAPAAHLRNGTIVVFDDVGHQGCSDIGLYGELAPMVPDLPVEIVDIVQDMATSVTGQAGDPWRPAVLRNLHEVSAFLERVVPPVV